MRPQFEVAQIIDRFGRQYIEQCQPNSFTLRTLDALLKCRTSALGGHKDICDCCGRERNSYNSCGNRHCPKCQSNKQAIWVDNRMNDALDVKYFQVVFSIVPGMCFKHSGTATMGLKPGPFVYCWGQNLSLHPHIHCIVPAAGLTLKGKLKHITKQGKYLYPVRMLSTVFRGKLPEKLKRQLKQSNQLPHNQSLLDRLWEKPWVVYYEPPLGNAQQIVKYLSQYTHRVAISNHRVQNVDDSGVSFFYKDYKDNSKKKLTKLSGVEFLRRFRLHILPYRFVKIRYYGILSSKQKDRIKPLQGKKQLGGTQRERNSTGADYTPYRIRPVPVSVLQNRTHAYRRITAQNTFAEEYTI
jgi:hypothetical protein